MRLNHVKVKAKEITDSCLIYLPKDKKFFWVDFVDSDSQGNIVFIFEEDITETGDIVTKKLRFKPDDIVINIVNDLNLSVYMKEGHEIIESYC